MSPETWPPAHPQSAVAALERAQRALAGEDTVEWARGAAGSHMSYPLVMGILDDLIEDALDPAEDDDADSDDSIWLRTRVYADAHEAAQRRRRARPTLSEAWHDVTCPEGPECRSRALHATSSAAIVDLIERTVRTADWSPEATLRPSLNRVHAVGRILRRRADAARAAARTDDIHHCAAAALRGKASGLDEAAGLVERLEHGGRFRRAKERHIAGVTPSGPIPPGVTVALRTDVLTQWDPGDGHAWEKEFADLRAKHAAHLATVRDSIREHGILRPILLGNDGRIWDGHHRLCVADELDMPFVPVEFSGGSDTTGRTDS